jgi:hypothetical protein
VLESKLSLLWILRDSTSLSAVNRPTDSAEEPLFALISYYEYAIAISIVLVVVIGKRDLGVELFLNIHIGERPMGDLLHYR